MAEIKLLEDVSAVGAGNPHSKHKYISDTTYQVVGTGTLTAVTVDIEGSIDGETYFQIGQHVLTAGQLTAKKAMFHIAGKPVKSWLANITTLNGTNPVITVTGGFQE